MLTLPYVLHPFEQDLGIFFLLLPFPSSWVILLCVQVAPQMVEWLCFGEKSVLAHELKYLSPLQRGLVSCGLHPMDKCDLGYEEDFIPWRLYFIGS